MKSRLSRYKSYIINLMVPAIVFGFVTGTLTSLIVMLYKLCAKHIIHFSQTAYEYLRAHLYILPLVLIGLFAVSLLLAFIYKKTPNVKGGGIPTSVGILRGIITFHWLKNLIGVFLLSLSSFLMGVPLGNEGPSVQMGTAIGRGSVYTFAKKHRAWDRYSMTGGACAGFSVATGAPISGIFFAIEEAHQRISPTIVIMASSSVLFASITSKLMSPILGVSEKLFEIPDLPVLDVKSYWIPLVVGVVIGIFSALFLNYYKLIDHVHDVWLKKIPHFVKIFAVLVLTVILGLCSFSFISTGHELILELFESKGTILFLLLVLLVRTTMTLSANKTGITGGTFIPILTLGAVLASIVGKALISFGVDSGMFTVILVLGITACISGCIKMPLTAIMFALEALSCADNVIPVVIVSFVAFLATEMIGVKSINDEVIEMRLDDEEEKPNQVTREIFVTVQKGSFAVGKQIRDIFWPKNLFVLSVKHQQSNTEVDEHGGKEIRENDLLHIRYSTADEENMKQELLAIIGEQELVLEQSQS